MIYHDMLVSKLEERWPLLTEFLGFQADEWRLTSVTMNYAASRSAAHLRGLHACFMQGRTYEEGVSEYLHRSPGDDAP
jgi:hypothetical protein